MSFIIFYGMDIIRQFSALGLIFLTIYNLSKSNYFYASIYWILSLSFHFSSIVFIFLFLYLIFNNVKFKSILLLLFVSFIVFCLLLFDLESLLQIPETNSYIDSQNFYQS